MSKVSRVIAREVLDSRARPTVEVEVILSDGKVGRAIVPSGASTGKHEALELRDKDTGRYGGDGVTSAVNAVREEIAPAIAGMSAINQAKLDRRLIDLDGTPNKGKLGANSVLAVSMATARAAAKSRGIPLYTHFSRLLGRDGPPMLPVPMFNVVNGGRHADNSTDFQEFMVIPAGFETFRLALQAGAEVYHSLRALLRERHLNSNVGDEGGFAPALSSNREAVELLLAAIERAGYSPGDQCYIGLDVAASEFFVEKDHRYSLAREGKVLEPGQLIDNYEDWAREYPIISIEDGMAEDEWDSWQALTERLGSSVQLVGDDIFTTNTSRIRRGIDAHAANAVLVKLNQIGTVTETMEAIGLAKDAGWNVVISHRSGETEDTTIADLAVGTGAGQIKSGAPARGERTAKYNQLLRIEEELGADTRFAGRAVYERFLSSG